MSNLWNSFPPPYSDQSAEQNQWTPSTPNQPIHHIHPYSATSTSTTHDDLPTSGHHQDQDDSQSRTDSSSAMISGPSSARPALETTGDAAQIQDSNSFSSKDSDQHGIPGSSVQHDGEASMRGEQPASLRRGMACTFCRKRKLRCSGEKPKCTSCVKYNKDCEYGQGTKGAKFQQLESRIAELSDYIKAGNPTAPPPHQHPSMLSNPSSSSSPAYPYSFQPSTSYGSMSIPNEVFDPSTIYPTDAYLDFSASTNFNTPDLGMDPSSQAANFSSGFAPFGNTPQMGYVPSWSNTSPMLPGAAMSVFPPFSNTPQSEFPMNGHPLGTPQGTFDFRIAPDLHHSSSAPDLVTITPQPPPHRQPQPQLETTPGQQTYFNHVISDGPPIPSPQDVRTVHEIPLDKHTKWGSTRQASISQSSPSSSATPDASIQPPINSTVDPKTPNAFGRPLPNPGMLHGIPTQILNTTHIDPVEGITESLGEFLFNPTEKSDTTGNEDGVIKRRRGTGDGTFGRGRSKSLIKVESDGLTESARELLLDCFLAHSRLFFEMSIPRFRYRMSFTDRRRPAPALLYAMYLWATRIAHSPKTSPMEQHFFEAATKALDVSSANGDRLIDCMRAAMLLSAFSYTSGRYHEGWILAGLAVRMVLSTGLHQIKSCVFTPEPSRDPFLRNKAYLLPPPEDATELAERLTTFWCIVAIDRCSGLATGFPVGIRDQDITTPFPRPLADIVSGFVSEKDDVTVKDIYRPDSYSSDEDTPFTIWMKTTLILEKASKLAFVDPDENSDYARAWATYSRHAADPSLQLPPSFLNQPKYRVPKEYNETKLALEQLQSKIGEEGIFPVDRRRQAENDGKEIPHIIPHFVMIHHQFAAIHMLLHDVNAIDADNSEAIKGARMAVALIRHLPPIPFQDVDTFCVTVWSIITKVLIKELRRAHIAGDVPGVIQAEEDVDLFIGEMQRVGLIMQLARSQAKAMTELKRQALKPLSQEPSPCTDTYAEYPHLKGGQQNKNAWGSRMV